MDESIDYYDLRMQTLDYVAEYVYEWDDDGTMHMTPSKYD